MAAGLDLGTHVLEHRWWGPGPDEAATLVFLHEGLGSTAQWRELPGKLAEAAGCGALAYSRRGYGRSDPLPAPFGPGYLEGEARGDLPAVLSRLGVRRAVLVGHSDGGSIALLAAADAGAERRLGGARLLGVVAEAPHVTVEPVTVSGVRALAERHRRDPELREGLRRRHGAQAEALFAAWAGVWSAADEGWSLVPLLPAVACPVLVVQGGRDEYGTRRQVETIRAAVSGPFEELYLPASGHVPHRDAAEAVRQAVVRFVGRCLAA